LEVLLSEDPEVVRRALTDTRGLEMLVNSINVTAESLRAGARRGVTQQITTDAATGGVAQGLLGIAP
jgi:hypothetical protein